MHSILSGQPDFSDAECSAVERVLRSGWVGAGPEVEAFEAELAAYLGARHVLAVSSCTAALMLSLKVLGVGPGDEVICPSLTWVADANVIVHLGARPVFCDVDPTTLSATADTIVPHVTERTKAVIVVHYGGLAGDMDALRSSLPDHVAIVEDAAHAIGAKYPNGSAVGGSGNLTCFSFHANKNLSTVEGGAVAVDDAQLAARIRNLRQQGVRTTAFQRLASESDFSSELVEPGYKMSFTDVSAALGRVQLARQREFARHRLALARAYVELVREFGVPVRFQNELLADRHARHLVAVLLPPATRWADRDAIRRRLRDQGIHAGFHYEPLHQREAFGEQNVLPVTDNVSNRLLSLPIGPRVTIDDVRRTVGALGAALKEIVPESVASPAPDPS